MMLHGLLERAAFGECEAQAQLANNALEMGVAGSLGIAEAISSAEIFARMAATHRRPNDTVRLAGILMLRASMVDDGCENEAACISAEALSILSALADEGHEEAAVFVQQIADALPPELTCLAANMDRLAAAADEALDEGLQ